MNVQLTLRKNDTRLTARIIQWWTGSSYSHCELVVNGVCYSSSAMDGGVRQKKIDINSSKWDVIHLPWANASQVLSYFEATDPHKYGWLGLITSQLFNLNREAEGAQFCSQWCAAALGLPNPASYSPRTLAELCEHMNRFRATAWRSRDATIPPTQEDLWQS